MLLEKVSERGKSKGTAEVATVHAKRSTKGGRVVHSSSQFQTSVPHGGFNALGRSPPVPIQQQARWVPEPVWTLALPEIEP